MVTTARITTEHTSFNRICQVCPYTPHLMHYVVPWAHVSPPSNGISIGLAILAGITDRKTDRQRDTQTDGLQCVQTSGAITTSNVMLAMQAATVIGIHTHLHLNSHLSGKTELASSPVSFISPLVPGQKLWE